MKYDSELFFSNTTTKNKIVEKSFVLKDALLFETHGN